MDQAFLLRARRLLEQRPLARIGFGEVLAAVTRRRDVAPTVRLAAAADRAAAADGAHRALTDLLLSGAGDVSKSAEIRHACFNRAVATRRVNDR